MSSSENVMERKVLYAGKTFIKAGEEHARAYIIQNGRIRSYIMEGERKVTINEYGPGRIVCETCLMSDEPVTMFYEAVEETTVATLTRAEFQTKVAKLDKTVADIMQHVMNKLNFQYADDVDRMTQDLSVDPDAAKLVQTFLVKVPDHRKNTYEDAILPHLNNMMRELKKLKEEDKDTSSIV